MSGEIKIITDTIKAVGKNYRGYWYQHNNGLKSVFKDRERFRYEMRNSAQVGQSLTDSLIGALDKGD